MLDVKEATRLANEHLMNLLGQDDVSRVRLEEVELAREGKRIASDAKALLDLIEDPDSGTDKYWLITLSYLPARPNPLIAGEDQRQYKIFKINAETGEMMAMKIRKVA